MFRFPSIRFLAAVALGCCTVPSAAQTVHVVDDQPGPGVHFTSLSEALIAASDGDVLLVKPGDYEADPEPSGSGAKHFTVEGKSLDVVGDVGGPVRLRRGSFVITGLDAGQTVSLVGLEFPDSGLVSFENEGVVLVKDCRFPAFKSGNAPPTPLRTISVSDTAAFLFEDSLVEGHTTPTTFGPISGVGVRATNSNLYLHDATVLGGKGQASTSGYEALHVAGGSLYASGSLFVGGQAGDWHENFGTCGQGGAGIVLRDGASAETLACTIVGGPTGNGCPAGIGQPGVAVDDPDGLHTITAATDHGIEVTSPVREGETAVLVAKGRASDQVFLLVSPTTTVGALAGVPGVLFVDSASPLVEYLGQLVHTSSEAFSIPVGQLVPSVQALPLSLQAVFVRLDGELAVSGLARLVVLDFAF